MSDEPFIASDDRPDLTLDLERKVGDLTVRELAGVLGFEPSMGDAKGKNQIKDHKDSKNIKDLKDQTDQKQHKDAKDQKDSKDHKEQKDQKEQKDEKEQKDSKDHKDHKDSKDGVFEKVRLKEFLKDVIESKHFTPEKFPGIEVRLAEIVSELDQLVKRVTGLEQSIEELKKPKKG
jgi:hypothetical protein